MKTSEQNVIGLQQGIMNITDKRKLFGWFINASEIAPGASAIIGGNRLAFFAIHLMGLCLIAVSFTASVIVIFHIHSKWRQNASKVDFPIRFPLYLAIADTLWGISHFTDHMYLVIVQVYPESSIKVALSMNLWLFFGYQQLMHASIAGYTYLRVVHSRKLDLGTWEWKLHSLWFGFLAGSIILFGFMDAFGNTGYWMGNNARTTSGHILGIIACFTATFNAVTTTLGYRSIRRTVISIKSNLRTYAANTENEETGRAAKKAKKAAKQESVASQCLTTYVCVASCLYCPLAILVWINVLFQIFMHVVEPLSCFLIIIVANCSGWANAYGYFHNERLKKRKGSGNSSDPSSTAKTAEQSVESNINSEV